MPTSSSKPSITTCVPFPKSKIMKTILAALALFTCTLPVPAAPGPIGARRCGPSAGPLPAGPAMPRAARIARRPTRLASAPREETDASTSKFFSPALGIRPPPRCTRRIRWRGDTSAHGYVMLVRMAQQRYVGVRADDIFFARVCRSGEPIKSRGLTTRLARPKKKARRTRSSSMLIPARRHISFEYLLAIINHTRSQFSTLARRFSADRTAWFFASRATS